MVKEVNKKKKLEFTRVLLTFFLFLTAGFQSMAEFQRFVTNADLHLTLDHLDKLINTTNQDILI